jgi:hypothetical protein
MGRNQRWRPTNELATREIVCQVIHGHFYLIGM